MPRLDSEKRHRQSRASEGVAWIGRVLSVVIAVGYVIAAIVIQDGITKWTPILALALLLPLALIWFPNSIGPATGYWFNDRRIDQPTPPILISIAGWFFLVGLPIILYVSWRR